MKIISTLVLILFPMLIGFLMPVTGSSRIKHLSEQVLTYIIFVLLLVCGIELALIDNLVTRISKIALQLIILIVLNVGSGIAALMIFDKLFPCPIQKHINTDSHNLHIHGSFIQLFCVVAGFLLGKYLPKISPKIWLPPAYTTTVLLVLLVFFAGMALKSSGVTIKEVLLNKRGLQISVIFTLVVVASGALFGVMFSNINIWQGMALSSGFGWYSLSVPIITRSYGVLWGSVALLNDLAREILAILLIPILMRRSTSAAVGVSGPASLDLTIPIIARSGGVQIIPLAVSFGFILNVVSPILIVFFANIS